MGSMHHTEITHYAHNCIMNINQIIPKVTVACVLITCMNKNQGSTIVTDDNILIGAANNLGRGVNIRFTKNTYVRSGIAPIIIGEEGKIQLTKEVTGQLVL